MLKRERSVGLSDDEEYKFSSWYIFLKIYNTALKKYRGVSSGTMPFPVVTPT